MQKPPDNFDDSSRKKLDMLLASGETQAVIELFDALRTRTGRNCARDEVCRRSG